MSPNQAEVVVIGAGPVGLAAAITLSQLGRQVAIVDSSTTTRNDARASVVNSRALEVLNTMGLADPIIERSIPCVGSTMYGSNNKLVQLDFSVLEGATPFPNPMLISQHEVEEIFREKLKEQGVTIYTNATVVDILVGENDLEVVFAEGSVTHTRYVVGADGAHSIVRKTANIGFKDPVTKVAYDNASVPPSYQVTLADLRIRKPTPTALPRNRVCNHLDTFLVMIPVPSNNDDEPLWRVVFGTPTGGPELPRNPSLEYLQQEMDKRNPWDTRMEITEVVAASRYRVRSAIADTYYRPFGHGHILLVGDAAHVHSPVGGQGMNLGICDAVAAAHAISAHVKAIEANEKDNGNTQPVEADAILQHYSNSRHAIGMNVVKMTKRMTAMVTLKTWWQRMLRNLYFLVFGSLPFVQRAAAWQITGLVNRD